MTQIKTALKKLVELEPPLKRAQVLTVDKNSYTCNVQVLNTEEQLLAVKLKSIVNYDNADQLGLVLFPAQKSIVTVAQVNGDDIDYIVVDMTQIDSVSMSTATALSLLLDNLGNVSFNATKLTFNNGKNGGIPLVNPTALAIQKLQIQVNQLIATFNAHIHPVAGEATGPTATPGPAPTAPVTQATDLANPNILQ